MLGALHFARTGEVWTFLGFPTYGGGLFERIGLATSVPLLVGYLLVCLADVAVGVMRWLGVPRAGEASYVLLPPMVTRRVAARTVAGREAHAVAIW